MADKSKFIFGPPRGVSVAEPFRDYKLITMKITGPNSKNEKTIQDTLFLVSVTGTGEVNIQIDVNFQNAMFITAFGDKLTPLMFRGIAIPKVCTGTGQTTTPSATEISNFYNTYKVKKDKEINVITVSYHKAVFKGVLVKMDLQPYTGNGLDGFAFDMTLQGRFFES